jgi:hypothetical protein
VNLDVSTMFLYESFRTSPNSNEEKKENDVDSLTEHITHPAVDGILEEVQMEDWYKVREQIVGDEGTLIVSHRHRV